MNDSGPASEPDDEGGSWTSETLPMSVRRELLERELRKLGFRKAGQGASAHPAGSVQQQQQPQPASTHPSAGAETDVHSG